MDINFINKLSEIQSFIELQSIYENWISNGYAYMVNRQQIFTLAEGHIKIKGVYVGFPKETARKALLEQGFTIVEEQAERLVLKGDIEHLGVCRLTITGDISIGKILVTTEKKYNEEEATAIFEQVKEELPDWPRYDYNGYGVSPRPHEIDFFWDLKEGLVKIRWDGHILFDIMGPIVKDEEYWRSEVD